MYTTKKCITFSNGCDVTDRMQCHKPEAILQTGCNVTNRMQCYKPDAILQTVQQYQTILLLSNVCLPFNIQQYTVQYILMSF